MSYEFYNKHILCALEWKLNAKINKNKKSIKRLDCSGRHSLIGKFSHVSISNEQYQFIVVCLIYRNIRLITEITNTYNA